jgi:hemolysin D
MSVFQRIQGVIGEDSRRLDREFLAPAEQLLVSPGSPLWRTIATAICALLALAIVIAAIAQVDIYAVARGRVQPIGRSKIVQPLEAGRVIRIMVHNGSQVAVGQVLAILDSTEPAATLDAARSERYALTAEIARRQLEVGIGRSRQLDAVLRMPANIPEEFKDREQAVLAGDLAVLRAQVADIHAKLGENEAQRSSAMLDAEAARAAIGTLKQKVAIRQGIYDRGWESKSNLLDDISNLQHEQSVLATAEGTLLQTAAARRTLLSQLADAFAKFTSDAAQGLESATGKLDQTRADETKASATVQHTVLRAPISGTVQELDLTTSGQVVASGQQLMIIVPRLPTLEIEALLANQDAGFVTPGQHAVVKLDAFPFTRYGTLSGRVVRVSRDAVQTSEASQQANPTGEPTAAKTSGAAPDPATQNLVYPTTIELDEPSILADGRRVTLTSGLTATVEIRTGSRSLLGYILSPLVEVASASGHER